MYDPNNPATNVPRSSEGGVSSQEAQPGQAFEQRSGAVHPPANAHLEEPSPTDASQATEPFTHPHAYAQSSAQRSTIPLADQPGTSSGQQFVQSEPGTTSFPPTPSSARRKISWLGALLAALIALTLFLFGWQFGAHNSNGSNLLPGIPSTTNGTDSARATVIAKVRPTVVQVNVTGSSGNSVGSGVIIDKRGYIITNNHVVEGGQNMEVVLSTGATLPAQLIGQAPDDDLAIVRIDPTKSHLEVAALGDSSNLQVGQEVLAIGNPLGITQTVTAGIVSALGRNVATGNGTILPSTIQTDAAINPGNSGGALVDMQGNLVGIPTLTAIDPQFKTPANGVGFAIPSNRVNFIAPQLIQYGKVTRTGRAALEIQAADVDPTFARQNNLPVSQGALVVEVTPGGSADKAGLKQNDVIVQINDQPVTGILSLGDILIAKNPGDTVSVKIWRGSQQKTVNEVLGELPARS
ncbi:S1C family serine protease [Tengunoibacter tsumagoiensis]|uniref:S1C family serine protease n=1 Tax=Tengunoibacter tsumagoiensis TaxID=2014871 RepID=UPI000F817549|nr:trypsin-like peptidase domain-containing protein [Tengunoibacter tsumagoiensis]